MLAWRGFIRQDSHTKAYMPGPSLARVAYSARRRNDLVASAQPIVDELSETLGETSHLGALEGTRVRYLIATESAAPVRVVSRVGKDYPAHATAVGKALLAGLYPFIVGDLTKLYLASMALPTAWKRVDWLKPGDSPPRV